MLSRYGLEMVTVASDRDRDGVADTGVIDRALGDASSLIDGYLAVRYDVPLSTVPEMIQRLCVDIALYQMSADAAVATDEQRRRYEDCLGLLKMIAAGTVSLGLDDPATEDPRSSQAWFESPARIFSRDTLRGS